jgi:hypothetical protein
MQNTNEHALEQEFPPSSPRRPDDKSGIAVTESLLIFDPKTAEKLVKKDRNAN